MSELYDFLPTLGSRKRNLCAGLDVLFGERECVNVCVSLSDSLRRIEIRGPIPSCLDGSKRGSTWF